VIYVYVQRGIKPICFLSCQFYRCLSQKRALYDRKFCQGTDKRVLWKLFQGIAVKCSFMLQKCALQHLAQYSGVNIGHQQFKHLPRESIFSVYIHLSFHKDHTLASELYLSLVHFLFQDGISGC